MPAELDKNNKNLLKFTKNPVSDVGLKIPALRTHTFETLFFNQSRYYNSRA
jgi:hypothetical protein